MHGLPTAAPLLHFPASQFVHAPAPPPLYFPAGHADAVALVDPAAHAYPAVQLLHDPAPLPLYCPAGHTNAVALVDPAGQ